MLQIQQMRTSGRYMPGETIELELLWELETAPQQLELRLVWNTVGKGDANMRVVQKWIRQTGLAEGREKLSLTLPEGPYSFSGQLIALQWGLELICFPQKESVREEIVIGPDEREIVLKQAADSFADALDE